MADPLAHLCRAEIPAGGTLRCMAYSLRKGRHVCERETGHDGPHRCGRGCDEEWFE